MFVKKVNINRFNFPFFDWIISVNPVNKPGLSTE